MAAIVKGTTCQYGVAGTVADLIVQSYTISDSFYNEAFVTDGDGLTITARYDDEKIELSVEGISTGGAPTIGDTLNFTSAAGVSFAGWVTKVEEKGGSKEFVKLAITGVEYTNI